MSSLKRARRLGSSIIKVFAVLRGTKAHLWQAIQPLLHNHELEVMLWKIEECIESDLLESRAKSSLNSRNARLVRTPLYFKALVTARLMYIFGCVIVSSEGETIAEHDGFVCHTELRLVTRSTQTGQGSILDAARQTYQENTVDALDLCVEYAESYGIPLKPIFSTQGAGGYSVSWKSSYVLQFRLQDNL